MTVFSGNRRERGAVDRLALALEPRFMYDAAGAATAATVADAAKPSQQDQAGAATEGGATEQAADHHGNTEAASLPGDSQGVSEAQPDAGAVAPRPNEIVFVDSRLPDIGQLEARDGIEIILLDPSRDGIAQVSEALAGRQGVTAIHFVGHGEGGSFTLGDTRIDAAALSQAASAIAGWGSALSGDADIMIWGCDVASLPSGEALLSSLSLLTGADVAASSDATGIASRGGDWTLEVAKGTVTSTTPFEASALATWDHLLAPPTVTGPSDGTLTVAEPSSLNAPGADRVSLSGWQFGSDVAGNVTVTATVVDTSVGTLSNGSGQGSAVAGGWTFTGALADANAWLDGLQFTAADVERGNGAGKTNISLTISDADGTSANRSIAVEVTPSNDPTALPDRTATVTEGASNTVITDTTFAALDPEVTAGTQNPSQIVYRLTDDPDFGYLTLNGQRIGIGSIFTQRDVIDGSLAYTHTAAGANQNTQDGFSVSVNDGATPQASSDTARISLNITPVNQAPTVSGSGALYEGQPANATSGGVPQSVVGSFITADGGGDPGDSVLQVRLTALPTHGLLYFTGTATIGGVTQAVTNRQVTAADIAAGFVFAYAARDGLTYANDGIDVGASPNGRPPNDSFGVEVIDGGGGSGMPATTAGTVQLTIRAVNDDPIWVESSTRTATVPAPTGNSATDYKVTLTTAMLNVTDVDSSASSITFVVTSQTALNQGRLVYVDSGGQASLLPDGGTFTLADVQAGRIQYWQLGGASAGDTDSFMFQVADNALGPRWNPDGTQFERMGGIYTGPTSSDTLRNFAFTINLAETAQGGNGTLPTRNTVAAGTSSTFAGTNASGTTHGTLIEGGTITLTNGGGGQPGLNYTAAGVDPSQVVYTVLGFDGAGASWNGDLQKLVNGTWVSLGVYDTFTQADLDAGSVRFQHDGGEDFESSVRLQASAGVLVSDGQGGLTTDQWNTSFTFYIKPVNDAPVATGSSSSVIDEGETVAITTGMLNFGDADDATSESYPENAGATLSDGSTNYAANNGANLTFKITSLPANGTLQYFDGTTWQVVTTNTVLQASWLTGDAGTTRLRYVHDGGEGRTDTFQAQATDRWGATSNAASVDFVITNINDAPQIAPNPGAADPTGFLPGTTTPGTAANNPLTVIQEGSYSQITSAMLQAVDSDSSAEQVQYRITTAPTHGRISYSTDGINFVTIGAGSSFTQADVAAGRIYYLSNGDEPGDGSAPDDKFTFTLADGAAEQAGNEFWIYVQPTNDAPVVTAPAGPIPVTDTLTDVPGFSVADPDMPAQAAGETDFLQVVVRLTHANGTAFSAADYAALGGVEIDVTANGATIDGDKNGSSDYLVLRGTRDQINAALATLKVSFGGDRDTTYQVQVIADDRVRDVSTGALLDRDGVTAGDQPGGNGGGTLNEPETPFTGTPTTVPGTEYDWYTAAVPTTGAIAGNIAAASVTIRASSVNDPATMTSGNAATTFEDQATLIGNQINFAITDPESAAFGTPVTVTLSVASGILNVGADPDVTVSGRDTGTLVLTGTAAEIESLLDASLTYRSASNVNHDVNGAADGDVTLTVSFSDTGSNLGTGQASANPSDLSIALTITPVNDAPTVAAGTGTVVVTGLTPVPGFSVGDIDASGDGGGIADGETDFVQVTVRITNSSGVPLTAAEHLGVTISSTASLSEGATFEIDDTYGGAGSALVIRGTQAQVNAHLAGLQVDFSGTLANSDAQYRVEVVADDRVRDVATGTLQGGANGGLNNNGGNGTAAVPTTAIDPYAAVPGGLGANVASNFRALFSSDVNDPAHIDLSGALITPEGTGSGIVQLSGITVTDSDALSGTLTATVTLPAGFTFASVNGSTGYAGVGTGSVTITGTLSEINTALNSIRIQLPDVAGDPLAADWNGQFNVTIQVNDGGNNGSRPGSLTGDTGNPGANPGDFSYADPASATDAALITTRTFTFTVTAVNDAPQVVGDGTETLPAVLEDTSPAGQTVSSLFQGQFGDPLDPIPGGSSSNSFAGVAVVANAAIAAQGTWQYSLDGNTWVDIGTTRSLSSALILSADTLVRFMPAADFHGTPNSLTVRLVEDGDGGNGSAVPATGSVVNLTGATGGTTRYSTDPVVLSTSVTNVNDRPTLGNGALSGVEDATNTGNTVSSLFGGSYSDTTDNKLGISGGGNAATAFGGIAIVGNAATAGQGTWEYSIDDGATWSSVPASVSDAAALLLPTDARLRFTPSPDFNGTPGGLTVRGADSAVSFDAAADISATVNAQTSTWSVTRALTTSVAARNDAPDLGGAASNPIVVENSQTGSGTSIPLTRLVNAGTVTLSDIDLTTTSGLASGVFGAGTITVSLGASYRVGDVLSVDGALPGGVNVSAGTDGTLIITFDSDTTVDQVRQVIEQISYASTSDNPTNYGADTTRSYSITVADGNNAQPGGNAGGPSSLQAAPITGTITIQMTNDPPQAVNDTNAITEDTASVGGNVVSGGAGGVGQDTDPDSTVLTVIDVSFGGTPHSVGTGFTATYGSLTLNVDGSYTYVLDNTNAAVNALKAGDTLTEVFSYTISDSGGLTSTATLTITIQGTTDGAPTIAPVDGNGGAAGQAEVHERGLAGGTAPSETSETTAGTITLTATDGLASVTVGGTTVTLAQLNNLGTAPVVIDTGEGTLTLNGFAATASVGGVPTTGTLSYSYSLKAAQNQPAATESTDPIALLVTDAGGGTSNGTLTVRIVDDAPVARDDAAEIVENTATVNGNVVTETGPLDESDSLGADGAAGGGAVTGVSFGGTARAVGAGFTATYGSLTLNADGSYTYVLDNTNAAVNALNAGDTLAETFSYTITDGDGETSTATLTITITGENDPPVAVDDVNSIVENTASVGGNVIAGGAGGAGQDSDPDSPVLTVVDIGFGGDPKPVGTPFDSTYGRLTLHPDGTYTYELDNNNATVNALKAGDPPLTEVFTYTINDGSGGIATATLTITITGFTDGSGPAVAPADNNGSADGEADVYEGGLGDPSTSETTTGTIEITAPDGLASIEVGGTTVSVAALGNLGTAPVVIDTGEGTLALTGFTPTSTVGGVPTSGTLTYAYTLKTAQNTPAADQSLDPITLEVTDVGGSTANGTLTVRIIDDAPVANPDGVEIGENATGATVSGNVATGAGAPGNVADDVGADGPSSSGTVTAVSFGGTTGTVGSALNGFYGNLTLNADGSYSYVLDSTNPAVEALNPGQTLTETYSYTITDGDGDTSMTTLTVTITGENDAPVVVGGGSSISGVEDDVIVLTLSDFPSSDVDAGDALEAVRIAELPTSGALYLDDVAVLAGGVISAADIAAGRLTYRPAPDGNGPSYASFGYQLGDGASFSATGTMNIDIAPRNDTPTVAGPTNATATEDVPLAFDGGSGDDHAPVLSIDDLTDLTQTGATDLFTLTLAVGHGTLTIADPGGTVIGEGTGASLSLTGTREALNAALKTLTYLADADYSGADQLLVGLDDHINAGSGPDAEPGTASHVVDILVRGEGDPPILSANPAQGTEDSWVPLDIDITSADLSDPETIGLDLTGLPAGWSIRAGTGEALVSTGADQVFRFTAADLAAGLSIMAPANVNSAEGQSITLGLTATSADGANTAETRGQLTVAIDPVNDRPGASGQIVLPTIDGVGTSGGTVADLFGGHYTDVTDNASVSHGAERDTPLAGVAIVGNDAIASQGTWEYDLGDGDGWRAIPTSGLGDRSALILPASAQIRFVPTPGFSGQPGGLVVRLSDGTGFPPASATPDALVDLTAIAAGALDDQTGGWSQQTVPVSVAVNALADTQAAFLDLPGYDRWGTIFHKREVYDEDREGVLAYLEGRPVDRYTVAWQPVSQQMSFRWSGGITEGKLTYEASLGRNEPLPSWITFNATMQTVTALPDHDVKPGVYVVRVVARDTAGHEAESTLTIHVLRDNAKGLEEIRRRVHGDKPHFGAPLGALDESGENGPRGQAEIRKPESDASARNAPAEARAPDAGTAANQTGEAHGASLTRSLIAFGPAGQMIEAARFLEALTLDNRSGQ